MLRHILAVVCLASALLHGAAASAQSVDTGGPDPASVRVHIGPLMMNPTIGLTNMGIDHNVFNDPPTRIPKEDFTFTLTPKTDLWLRMGPTWLSGNIDESINWYQKYASERTANSLYGLGWSVPLSRMNFKMRGTYNNTRERPGFEIDTRAEHTDISFNASYDYNAFSKTFIGVTGSQTDIKFVEDAEYLGVSLHDTLNRRSLSYGLTMRHQLTPLTTVSGDVTRTEDKFDESPDRNTVATVINGALAFTPEALLRGGISAGYEVYRPVDPSLPEFRGFVGSINLTYVLLGSTRFAVAGSRSTRYSFDVNQPYYVQSQIGGSVAQQIFGPLDVQVRGDYAVLDYRNRAGADVLVPNRTDNITTVGIGIGYHLGKDLRLSFNVDQNNRDSRVIAHEYERLLLGVSLVYGF
jgi:hypothetical protein